MLAIGKDSAPDFIKEVAAASPKHAASYRMADNFGIKSRLIQS